MLPTSTYGTLVKEAVRAKYDAIAKGKLESGFCMADRASDQTGGYESNADLSLSCGLPLEYAQIRPGELVLDLGSGAGLDAFIARKHTGTSGRVIGLDFAPAMVEKARKNAVEIGADNVEFHIGDIESMPFEDASFDVVVSNCTLNLVPDKDAAFRQVFRVLRPGGRFVMADVVVDGLISPNELGDAEQIAGCVAGAMDVGEYLELIERAGFECIEQLEIKSLNLPRKYAALKSTTVTGWRPPLKSNP